MKLLNGKTVLITGAASGIGYETALSFASRGSDLVITDINERALAAVRDEAVLSCARSKSLNERELMPLPGTFATWLAVIRRLDYVPFGAVSCP